MMNLIKLGAIIVLLVTGQTLAQTSKIVYTLELGGNNHAASWKSPTPNCNVNNLYPAFTSTAGGTLDGQSFTAGTIVTWAAQVAVTGSVGGNMASGAANLVANLELHYDSATGPLVIPMVHGSATTTGWYSTINNNVCTGTRYTTCGEPCENREDAAFADAWQVDTGIPTISRAIDDPAGFNGPDMDYYQYPSTNGHPAGSTAAAGKLLGIGCGYSKFSPYGCPACGTGFGLNTAGVGMTAVTCGVALGKGPIFEGQMNTSGLANGTYVLVLVPGTGNNVLKGGFDCTNDDPNSFALAPDDPNTPLNGDTITFTISISDGFCPSFATNPSPANSATGVSITPTLSWTAGSGATSHDVYFGTSPTPPFIQTQAGTTYNPGTLANNTLYYWRINEVDPPCTTTGTVWSFTTVPTRSFIAWQSLRAHTGCGDMPIVLNAAATTTATVETRGASPATQGVFKVHVIFSGAMTGLNSSGVAVLYTPTIQGGSPSMATPVGVTPATVTMFNSTTLELTFTAGQLPNLGCVKITLGASTFNETITGDVDCNIRVLAGDTNGSGTVNTTDQAQTKAQVSMSFPPCGFDPKFDINLSGSITTTDQVAIKAQVTSPPKTALCP